jgi:phosphatidylserine decarboxylase
LGIFQFGGSSIILAFQKGRIRFDDDLRECSRNRIQVAVEVGMSLGEATQAAPATTKPYQIAQDENAPSYADAVKEG